MKKIIIKLLRNYDVQGEHEHWPNTIKQQSGLKFVLEHLIAIVRTKILLQCAIFVVLYYNIHIYKK